MVRIALRWPLAPSGLLNWTLPMCCTSASDMEAGAVALGTYRRGVA
jgi:hypothetical protein